MTGPATPKQATVNFTGSEVCAPGIQLRQKIFHCLIPSSQSKYLATTQPQQLFDTPTMKVWEACSRKLIEDAVSRNGWNQTKAAAELGLQRTYLTKLLRQKQIPAKPPATPSD